YKAINYEQSLTTFERFYNNNTYFDVEFTFEEVDDYNNSINITNTIKAHRVILSQRSEYFDKLFNGNNDGFSSSGTTEYNFLKIPIRHVKYETFDKIIYYLYSLKLKDNLSFDLLKDIYINAETMKLENLCKLVADQLAILINCYNWDQVLEIAWNSNILSSKLQLKNSALNFVHENWSILRDTENMERLMISAT